MLLPSRTARGILACLLFLGACAQSTPSHPPDGAADDSGDFHPPSCPNPTAILPDCARCPAEGRSVENMRCAVGLCDNQVYLGGEIGSPVRARIKGAFEATARLGSTDMGETCALLATGSAAATEHDVDLGGSAMVDPFLEGRVEMHDVIEWRLHLRAPAGAGGIRIRYVFLSADYDENVGGSSSDKFRIILQAPSVASGAPVVINFAPCREGAGSSDFVCADAGLHCELGQPYCHISVNSALSECCWRRDCASGRATDLAGTGFECAASRAEDGPDRGGSTGWLVTEWPIATGEAFDLVFQIHDAGDSLGDSEAIIDEVLFVGAPEPGTRICE
ncbi:MAG: hypothetical protein JXR96_09405 [Deltaproteobacteria bacterium]|nr:hypothetical protein [Deltaproteobacteria bacterium]